MYLSAIILFMLMSCVFTFNLTILHTNDVHAHYEEMNKYGGQCDNPGSCYGGMARLKYKVDEIKRLYPNTLFLDGGDQYQGTLWFTQHGGTIVHTYMNLVGYDAMVCTITYFTNKNLVCCVCFIYYYTLNKDKNVSKKGKFHNLNVSTLLLISFYVSLQSQFFSIVELFCSFGLYVLYFM